MSLRLDGFHVFAREHLPPPPSRVLEIGCGKGDLARALASDGYDLTAIDPDAPEGVIFRRVALEELSGDEDFDAIVASLSLHHVEDIRDGVDRVAAHLRDGGMLVLLEFAKERLTGATARWYHAQRRARSSGGEHDVPSSYEEWLDVSARGLAGVHTFTDLHGELDRRFVEHALVWVPYLYSHGLDDSVEPAERALIAERRIEATGVLYAGRLREAG